VSGPTSRYWSWNVLYESAPAEGVLASVTVRLTVAVLEVWPPPEI